MSETTTTLTPHISCRNASEAVGFYQKAFGAEPVAVHHLPDGRLMHATLNIGGATLFLVDEFPEQGGKSPQALGGSPVMLALNVKDCDAVYQRAIDAGCEVRMPLQDMFWGDRWGLIADPYGHQWSIATTIRQVSPEELQQTMAGMSAGDGCPA
jgi:PhnB protein